MIYNGAIFWNLEAQARMQQKIVKKLRITEEKNEFWTDLRYMVILMKFIKVANGSS